MAIVIFLGQVVDLVEVELPDVDSRPVDPLSGSELFAEKWSQRKEP